MSDPEVYPSEFPNPTVLWTPYLNGFPSIAHTDREFVPTEFPVLTVGVGDTYREVHGNEGASYRRKNVPPRSGFTHNLGLRRRKRLDRDLQCIIEKVT